MEPYKETIDTVVSEFDADLADGLTEDKVQEQIKNNGKNKFDEAPKESLIKKFFHSLTDFTTIILLVAAVISLYTAIATDHGDYFESFLIIAIVVINSVLAIVQEGNAEKALSALQDMNKQTATVMRDGKQEEIDAENLVPGDTLLLESGSMITADARIVEASQLRVEESALTGESEPVMKDPEYQGEEDDALGCLLYTSPSPRDA